MRYIRKGPEKVSHIPGKAHTKSPFTCSTSAISEIWWKHQDKKWNLFKSKNKDIRTKSGVLKLSTLNRFHTLLWCCKCWLWTSKCRLGSTLSPDRIYFMIHLFNLSILMRTRINTGEFLWYYLQMEQYHYRKQTVDLFKTCTTPFLKSLTLSQLCFELCREGSRNVFSHLWKENWAEAG